MAEFNHEKAIRDYTELSRLIRVGAYQERSTEHYETGTYPEDGVEESIDNLERLAAQHGLGFYWHKDSQTFTLEPMSDEELAAFRLATETPGNDMESIETHIQELNEQEGEQA